MTEGITIVLDTSGLDRLAKLWPEKAARLLADTAIQIEQLAKLHAPRDNARPPMRPEVAVTGNLRNSIRASMLTELSWEVTAGGESLSPDDYAIYQEGQNEATAYTIEYGTSGRPARPFLRPSVFLAEKDFQAGLEKIAREGM